MNFVVVFKAEINQLDDEYYQLAKSLRLKAMDQYRCQKFETISENNLEIALSYWLSLGDIQAWSQDPEHLYAQNLGKSKWYKYSTVEICQIHKIYST